MFTNKSTVAGIMSSFTKTIRDLEVLAETRRDLASDKLVQAAQITQSAQSDRIEAEDAAAIARKLTGLIKA